MQTEPNIPTAKKPRDLAGALYEWCDAVVYALIGIVIVFTLVFKVTTVVGTSMINTLHERDILIISKLGYEPSNGDIVVISMDNMYFKEPIVKRIIASGGETVDIDFNTHTVSVTDVSGVTRVLEEDYILSPTATAADVEFPLEVPEGYLFVMGDNRNGSTDSRDSRIGLIDSRRMLGHVVFRLFPITDIGVVK